MKRFFAVWTICAMCMGTAYTDAQWERELNEMGYLILHISSINVINGLQLNREQTEKLLQLAERVERGAVKPPGFKTRLNPDMQEVRTVYLELRQKLLAGETITGDMEQRVLQARTVESRIVRQGLRDNPNNPNKHSTACIACHTAPYKQKHKDNQGMTVSPRTQEAMNAAHAMGVFGWQGLVRLKQVTPEIEKILSTSQKAIVGDFSCCLVPAEDLRNPARVGQAGSEKAVDLLRKARRCPDNFWPIMRSGILSYGEGLAKIAHPGITPRQVTQAQEKLGQKLDAVRDMDEIDFELEKDKLATSLKTALGVEANEEASASKNAFFLMIPGASQAYRAYLAHMDEH